MSLSIFTPPAVTINGYLWDTIKKLDPALAKTYGKTMPFFPISDAASGTSSWENKAYVIYDRMLQPITSPFPYIKREHVHYSVKGNEQQSMQWSMAIQTILDRMDDAGKDVNEWNKKQTNPEKIFFHSISTMQFRNPTEVRDFSNRPHFITNILLDCEYHYTESLEQYLS
jgi:hypothetical protein